MNTHHAQHSTHIVKSSNPFIVDYLLFYSIYLILNEHCVLMRSNECCKFKGIDKCRRTVKPSVSDKNYADNTFINKYY